MSKKITIDNIQFEETNEIYPIENGLWYQNKWYKPINKYKTGDWVIYSEKNLVRRIVADEAYSHFNGGHQSLENSYKEWMTENAAKEWGKEIKRKATESEIKQHLAQMAKEKGLIKGAKVKRLANLGNTTFVTIVQGDDDYYLEQDEYCKSGIILYSNGQWVTKIEEPKFTFGGCGVSFNRVEVGQKYNFRTIEITCKGETGTNFQIANILTHYFRPMPFGNVFVKKWIPKNSLYTDIHLGINTHSANDDLKTVDKITIGCLTGTYKELKDIYEHCQTLLK